MLFSLYPSKQQQQHVCRRRCYAKTPPPNAPLMQASKRTALRNPDKRRNSMFV
jgi:hypothetical protein